MYLPENVNKKKDYTGNTHTMTNKTTFLYQMAALIVIHINVRHIVK